MKKDLNYCLNVKGTHMGVPLQYEHCIDFQTIICYNHTVSKLYGLPVKSKYFWFYWQPLACSEEGLQTSLSGGSKLFVPFPYFYLLLKNVKIKSFGFCLVSTTVYFSPFSFV